MNRSAGWSVAAMLLALSCSNGPEPPAKLEPSSGEACRWCRMAISDQHTAAQVVAPLQDPLFFDDIGCLINYLKSSGTAHRGAVAYVADHRTGAWVPASIARYTKAPALDTPMGSRLIAHADVSSREADPASAGGDPVTATDLYGPAGAPDGHER